MLDQQATPQPQTDTPVILPTPGAPPPPAADPGAAAGVEQEATTATEQPKPDAPDTAGDEDKPKKRSASGRIAQLYSEKRAAETEAAMARDEVRRLNSELQRIQQMRADPNTPYEQQEELRVREAVKTERAEQLVSEARLREIVASERRAEAFRERVDEVRDRFPDFDTVVNKNTPISEFAADLIGESPVGPQIAYHLGKNPDLARRIIEMPPHRQGVELARIEASMQVPVRKVSAAPPPPPRIGGGQSPGAKDPQDMSMAEYTEWYRKRGKAN